MIKKAAIYLYLLWYKISFKMFSICRVHKKVTFLVSFGDNSWFVYNEIVRQYPETECIFIYEKKALSNIKDLRAKQIYLYKLNVISQLKICYHLATSSHVIIDNYFALLSVINFREDVECIQLWHAAGAIKTFGLADASLAGRSKSDIKRFKKVYKNFKKVAVGSEAMAEIFKKAFGLKDNNIIRTGVPRTDLFFDKKFITNFKINFFLKYPYLMNKKLILYAPTFRDEEEANPDIKLDIKRMEEKLGNEGYHVIIKRHPILMRKNSIISYESDFATDLSLKYNVNQLLFITDILVSDYSSIPFEFAILNKPMIFYAYDLASYKKNRGIWINYEEQLPGPIAYNTDDVIRIIENENWCIPKITNFSELWNKYSDGQSSERLVNHLFKESKNISE